MRPRSSPVAAFKASPLRVARFQVQATADPTQETKTPVESAIESAKKTCDDGTTQECAAAWDEVEELAANASHRKEAKQTDLEEYCDDNPEADECRVYED
jgi:poly(3-hydroxybutyrate) depolymerase